MFEQDYIMRQIQQLVKALVKILFHKDVDSPSLALLQNEESQIIADELLRKIDSGNIREAENELSELSENKTMEHLLLGIVFYTYLNEKDDRYLEINDMSRDEVKNGLKQLLSGYGLETMANMFFYDEC